VTEPITRLFERAERAGDPLPVPETAGVVARARRIRARRRLLAAAGTAAAVIAAVGAVHLLAPGAAPGGGLPAMSPTASDRALGRSADGLLLPVDLGPVGWTRDPGAATAGPLTGLSQPGCAGGSTGAWSALGENGQTAMFRGRTPTGAEWIASETVVATLGARSRQQISGLLHATSTGCTALDAHTVVLAANDTMLISGTLLPSGAVGYAQGYALSGSAWVTVDTLPGGAIGGVSLPGQTAWLTDVIASAVERVTGTRPVTPPPNAAARRAAAAGASASIDLSNDIRTIAPAPAGTAPAGTGAPRGFLPLAALGTTGAWTVGDQPTDRVTANATTITLPVVGPVAALSVTAPGAAHPGWRQRVDPLRDRDPPERRPGVLGPADADPVAVRRSDGDRRAVRRDDRGRAHRHEHRAHPHATLRAPGHQPGLGAARDRARAARHPARRRRRRPRPARRHGLARRAARPGTDGGHPVTGAGPGQGRSSAISGAGGTGRPAAVHRASGSS